MPEYQVDLVSIARTVALGFGAVDASSRTLITLWLVITARLGCEAFWSSIYLLGSFSADMHGNLSMGGRSIPSSNGKIEI